MDDILTKLLASSPSAVACIVMVILFIKHIDNLSERQDRLDSKREKAWSEIVERNTEVIEHAANEITKSTDLRERVEDRLRKDHNGR